MKKTSVNRMLSQFKDVNIAQISLAQSGYQSKDANVIRQALGKPNISDSYAIGLGNLANQYIKNLNQPKPQFIRNVASITKQQVILTTDYRNNLKQLGNEGQKKPTGASGVRFDAIDIISKFGTLNLRNKFGNAETTIKSPNNRLILTYFKNLQQNHQIVKNQLGLKEYRLYVECKMSNGDIKWVSTTWHSLNDRIPVNVLIGKMNIYTNPNDNYLYSYIEEYGISKGNVTSAKVDSYISCQIEYR